MSRWVALGLLLLGSLAHAQAPPANDASQYRADVLRGLLRDLGTEPLRSAGELRDDPGNSLLVVVGPTKWIDANFPNDALRAWVESGGAVLVASDTRTAAFGWSSFFRLSISGRTVSGLGHDCYTIDGVPQTQCPLLVPSEMASPAKDLWGVATIRPSTLSLDRGSPFRRWAYLPGEPKPASVAGAAIESGRIAVVSDNSVFSNRLMIPLNLDNFTLAERTLNWLQEKSTGDKRRKCLVVEGGVEVPSLEPDYFDQPMPDVDSLVPILDVMADELDRTGFWNRMIDDRLDPHGFWKVLVVGLTACLGLYGFHRLFQSREWSEPGVTPVGDALATLVPGESLLQTRVASLAAAGDATDATRLRAREMLTELGGPVIDPAYAVAEPPPIRISALKADAQRIAATYRLVWALAYAATTPRVMAGDWPNWVARIEELRHDAAVGRWSFEQSEGT